MVECGQEALTGDINRSHRMRLYYTGQIEPMNLLSRQPVAVTAAPAADYVRIESGRVDWVDYLKGFCILLVVMLHSVYGVEKATGKEGWMDVFVATAQPMRMPAFFLASGLFLMRGIDAPLTRFFDRKILHFAYFYALWLTIQFVFKAPGMVEESGAPGAVTTYFLSYVQPFGTLWFIYILPAFYIVARLMRAIAPAIMLAAAVLLPILPVHTGACGDRRIRQLFSVVLTELRLCVARLPAGRAGRRTCGLSLAEAAIAIAVTWWATGVDVPLAGRPAPLAASVDAATLPLSMMPVVSLLLGLVGSAALIALSAVLARRAWLGALRWCGAHSVVIHLAFFLPVAVTRAVLPKLGIVDDIGTISLLVWIAAVLGPVVPFVLIEKIGIGRFLFEQPAWARIKSET